jgi:hypothetical protein
MSTVATVCYLALGLAMLVLLAFKQRIDERAAKTNRGRWIVAWLLVGVLGFVAPFLVSAMTDAYQRGHNPPPKQIWSPYDDPSYNPYRLRPQSQLP